MALLSIGGTSMVEVCARARMRLVASSVGTSSTSATGFASASSRASASSTREQALVQCSSSFFRMNCAIAVHVVQVEQRQFCLHFGVARHRDDVRVVRVQQRLAGLGAPHLELGDRRELEALDQQQVAGRDALHLLLERRLVRAAQLVHQHPAPRRGHQDLRRAGMAVAVGILARVVDVEGVVRVLDQRHAQPVLHEARDELLDERGLAAAGPAGEAEGLHLR